jgi:hypothetical protein
MYKNKNIIGNLQKIVKMDEPKYEVFREEGEF